MGEVPSGDVTVTSTILPAIPGGTTASMVDVEMMVKDTASTVSKRTDVTFGSEKYPPVMVTVLPPCSGPLLGVILVTTGVRVFVDA